MSILSNLTVCLYTSTKGHFGRTDIYKRTVEDFLSRVDPSELGGLAASIKFIDLDGKQEEIVRWLVEKGFTAYCNQGQWKHGDESHQIEYIKDQAALNSVIKTEFFLHLEDDWLIRTSPGRLGLIDYLYHSVRFLQDNPSVTQVRIPRFVNEPDRIRGLMAKHGIDGQVSDLDDLFYRSNDWSNNPFIARTRDMRAAITFVANSNLPRHSEHGIGRAMAMLGWSELPFAFLNPQEIRCFHIGTPEGQEDSLDKELLA